MRNKGLLGHFNQGFVCFVLKLGLDIRRAFTGPFVLWLCWQVDRVIPSSSQLINEFVKSIAIYPEFIG